MTKPGGSVKSVGYAGAADACEFGLNTVPFMATDAQMLAEASSEANPKLVRPLFDTAQQVGEMLELGATLKGLSRNGTVIRNELDRLRKWTSPQSKAIVAGREIRDLSISDWSALAVQNHLGYQFAVKPTIKAAHQLVSTARRFNKELEKYFGSVQVLHGRSVRESTDSYSTTNSYHEWGNDRVYRKVVHATAEVIFRVPPNVANALRLSNALLGLTPHVDTAWELTPLSFIVDMFADFGSVLRQWAETPLDFVEYDVVRTGWSVKNSATSTGWININAGTERSGWRNVKAPQLVTGTLTKVSYMREPKVLDLTSFTPKPLYIRIPNAGQLASIAEVAYAIKLGMKQFTRNLS